MLAKSIQDVGQAELQPFFKCVSDEVHAYLRSYPP